VHPGAELRLLLQIPRSDQLADGVTRLVLDLALVPGRYVRTAVGGGRRQRCRFLDPLLDVVRARPLAPEQRHHPRPSIAVRPVDPKPPSPRALPGSRPTSTRRACATRWMTS